MPVPSVRQKPQVVYFLIGRELGLRQGFGGRGLDRGLNESDVLFYKTGSEPLQRYAEEKASLPNKNQVGFEATAKYLWYM